MKFVKYDLNVFFWYLFISVQYKEEVQRYCENMKTNTKVILKMDF